jgi:hypothetical protein
VVLAVEGGVREEDEGSGAQAAGRFVDDIEGEAENVDLLSSAL